MDDTIGMEKCEGQSDIVTDVDLHVVAKESIESQSQGSGSSSCPSAPSKEPADRYLDLGTCSGTG